MVYKDLESTARDFLSSLQVNEPLSRLEKFDVRKEALLEVVHNAKFAKGKNSFIVLINNRSYTVYGFYYCSCKDFYMKNLVRNKNQPCKHMLALAYYVAKKGRYEPSSLPASPKATTAINTNRESMKPM